MRTVKVRAEQLGCETALACARHDNDPKGEQSE